MIMMSVKNVMFFALDDGTTHEHEIGEFCGDDLHDIETNGYTLPSEMTIKELHTKLVMYLLLMSYVVKLMDMKMIMIIKFLKYNVGPNSGPTLILFKHILLNLSLKYFKINGKY